ncbi:hypothetical protein LXL04_033028 [Taraxacum kok-saghyz]
MVLCFCGRVAIVRTAWTSTNPGRRFHACPKQGSRCGFLGWIDPPMCARSVDIIPGLLRNINKHEIANSNLMEETTKWMKYFLASWVMFLVVWLVKS